MLRVTEHGRGGETDGKGVDIEVEFSPSSGVECRQLDLNVSIGRGKGGVSWDLLI